MNSFIAAPNQQHHVGQPICRSKRRCDVVSTFGTLVAGYDPNNPEGRCIVVARTVVYRPMTWWESLKHELFGECEGENS
jgi:hypothetical protein